MVQTLFGRLDHPLSWTGIYMKQRDPLSEPLIDTDLIDWWWLKTTTTGATTQTPDHAKTHSDKSIKSAESMVQTLFGRLAHPLSEPLIDTDLIEDDDDWKQLQRAQPRKRLITPKPTQINQ